MEATRRDQIMRHTTHFQTRFCAWASCQLKPPRLFHRCPEVPLITSSHKMKPPRLCRRFVHVRLTHFTLREGDGTVKFKVVGAIIMLCNPRGAFRAERSPHRVLYTGCARGRRLPGARSGAGARQAGREGRGRVGHLVDCTTVPQTGLEVEKYKIQGRTFEVAQVDRRVAAVEERAALPLRGRRLVGQRQALDRHRRRPVPAVALAALRRRCLCDRRRRALAR